MLSGDRSRAAAERLGRAGHHPQVGVGHGPRRLGVRGQRLDLLQHRPVPGRRDQIDPTVVVDEERPGAGDMPAPKTTSGRCVIAKWPLPTLVVAKFVRTQRELGFGLSEIRLRIIEAFGEKILEVLDEPRGPRARARGGKKLAKRPPEMTAAVCPLLEASPRHLRIWSHGADGRVTALRITLRAAVKPRQLVAVSCSGVDSKELQGPKSGPQ